jgi:sortase A
MDIELDSIVMLVDKETVYEYKIYDKVIVEETDFYMIEQEQSKKRGVPIISLMTCYYTSKNGKRFFALGELVKEYPYEELRENKGRPVPIS